MRRGIQWLRSEADPLPEEAGARFSLDALPATVELFGGEQLVRHAKTIAAGHAIHLGRAPERLLRLLEEDERVIEASHRASAHALAQGQRPGPAAEWLLDNFYLIQEQIHLTRKHLPRGFSRELPRLAQGPRAGLPRVFDIASELIFHTDGRFDPENLSRFIQAYQTVSTLRLGELWAIPIMLRLALVSNLRRVSERVAARQRDRDLAERWANRFLEVATSRPNRLIVPLGELVKSEPPLTRPFVVELVTQLQGKHAALGMVLSWLEQELSDHGQTFQHVLQVESQDVSADQAAIANSISGLRALGATDWPAFVETHSVVEAWLRHDPPGVYPKMDFRTRDRYRHAIERLARHSPMPEQEIAQQAVVLAKRAQEAGGGNGHAQDKNHADHVGYYLIAEGCDTLESTIGYRRPLLESMGRLGKRRAGFLYAAGLMIGTAALTFLFGYHAARLGGNLTATTIALVAVAMLAFQTALALVNWIGTALVSPKSLPRMDFSRGIPAEARAVVVIPTMLASKRAVHEMIQSIEVRFLANQDPHLAFALLTDFPDSPSEHTPEDQELLDLASAGVRGLNYRHPKGGETFFLFQRPRLWNAAEGVWMGRERKRGKIGDFSRFLLNNDAAAFSKIEGDPERLRGARYVIVLDADTQLPPLTAWKLVGTMAHPLNEPVIDLTTHRVVRGYGLLQPRVSVGLAGARRSRYARLFSGEAGLDPYSGEVSDVYQDLFGQGSFVGKGVFDVHAFHACTGNRFPDNTVLSHDLIEGCYSRSGFVSDVELIEEPPAHYLADANRRHRWTRGDWQIAPWLFPHTPVPAGRQRNPLTWLSQWKILDNLRRSLLPIAALVLILLGLFALPSPMEWMAIVIGLLFVPVVLRTAHAFIAKPTGLSVRSNLRHLARREALETAHALLSLEFLPFEAMSSLDAITRVVWRKLVSHKRLLEWQTSMAVEQSARKDLPGFLRAMWVSIAAAVLVAALAVTRPAVWPLALAVAVAWMVSPWVAQWLSKPLPPRAPRFKAEEAQFFGRVARRTWRYFEQYANEQTNWIAPDNYQEKPVERLAERTSPTNIGLGLLADLAAWDFGFATGRVVLDRIGKAVATMERLDRYRGHFYNWYDTRTLAPLPPRYVSTVDSGNLAASLMTLRAGLGELSNAPVLPPRWLQGLRDTIGVLREEIRMALEGDPSTESGGMLAKLDRSAAALLAGVVAEPQTLAACDALIFELAGKVEQLRGEGGAVDGQVLWWLDALHRQCTGLRDELVTLIPWRALAESDLHHLGQALLRNGVGSEEIARLQKAVRTVPTLHDLAQFDESFAPMLAAVEAEVSKTPVNGSRSLAPWLTLVREHARPAADAAAERLDELTALCDRCAELAAMDFAFLFDPKRKLFVIGFNADHHRLDPSHYDLLASEARLTSFFAIAFGQAPHEHWFMLARNLTPANGSMSLVSWSGAMFEYLMPMLFTPDFEGTLLDETCRAAVLEQIDYGRERGVPWGISESGYNLVDAQLNYQYRAFGVPSLGLKRGLSEDLVVAPYAAVMATMLEPGEAYRNLRDMEKRGFLGACGFYEAIDYTAKRVPEGQTFAIVRSFMAHHSGMSLLSLASAMLDRPMQRRFLAVPEFRSTLVLLQERVPLTDPDLAASEYQASTTEGPHDTVPDEQAITRVFTRPDPVAPRVALLSNGRYNVMLTDSGGGYSHWHEIALTRWREDRTRDDWGTFIYLRDVDRNIYWSAAQQPTGREPERYEAIFTQGKVEYRRLDQEIETYTQIAVSPEDDAEVRRVRVTNFSKTHRRLELTTYAEVVLANPTADIAHRAFSNLFVQTELQPQASAVLAARRPRAAGEAPPWLVHLVTPGKQAWGPPSFETDRARFLGRGRSPRQPAAMDKTGPLSGTSGAVLDPIVAIRRTVDLGPGESAELDIVLGMAPARAGAQALIDRYRERQFADRVFETAWTHSQVLLQHLGASVGDAQVFNRLAGALVFGDPSLRSPATLVARNRRGQPALWGYGISGDAPIVLLTLSDVEGLELVGKLIQAHAWWRNRGLVTELVILIDEPGGYRLHLFDQVMGMVATSVEAQFVDKPGGVFVRNSENMPEDDRLLLQAVARLTLNDRAGSIYDQADRVGYDQLRVPKFQPSRPGGPPPAPQPLPTRELLFSNGTGGFTPDGREYVIRLEPGKPTPAPWANVLANGVFGTVVSESGGAYTWFENAHEFRLTPWQNDPVSDASGESLYIRDEVTGRFWSPTPLPAPGRGEYICRHGLGYTVFEHDREGIFSETTTYVAFDAPVKFVLLRLQNHSQQGRRLSVSACFDWVLGDAREKSQAYVVTRLDPRSGAVFASNAFNPDYKDWVGFAHCYPTDRSFTADRTEFYGRNGSPASPAAMGRQRLSNRSGATLDPCAALQSVIDIPAGQERHVVFLLGAAHHEREAQELLQRFRGLDAARRALEEVWSFWKRMLGSVYVETPDPGLDILLNHWCLYQVIACRLWGRSGYYQSGGAFGFRDQLQDTMALLHAAPWLLREQIVRCASRQFREGDVQHWWHPPIGRGVRTHFSDDYLWLPYAVCRYVTGTGDTGVLDQEVPFLEGRPVKENEEGYYDLPKISEEKASLYAHCLRAIRHGLRYGAHGLPLIGCGDWNDGMNRVGAEGKGESIWLAFFLFDVVTRFVPLAERRNDQAAVAECRAAAEHLKARIEDQGWDGAWYRRAYFDDGTPLGSAGNSECQIDSISQSWAVLSGAGDPQRVVQAMGAVSKRLIRDDLRLIQLFDPPFDATPLDPGYVKGYIPGVRENGAQYTHAAVWAAMAFGQLGDVARLWRCFEYLNPINHARNPEEVQAYKVEPYVVAADIYTNPQHAGRGGWTWYTGSAGWMYNFMLETMLGVRIQTDRLTVAPRVPPEWKSFRVHYRYRETLYHITVNITGPETTRARSVVVDGEPQADLAIKLVDDRAEHHAEIEVG